MFDVIPTSAPSTLVVPRTIQASFGPTFTVRTNEANARNLASWLDRAATDPVVRGRLQELGGKRIDVNLVSSNEPYQER